MGRKPCCAKEGLNRGAWSAWEDKMLSKYVEIHGEGKWRDVPQRAGLKRCGKSCRLRWLNYLRPDIKRGNISLEEEELIIRLHKLLGNKWSLIAGRLPGRTDNEIKNYWNTNLSKRLQASKVQDSSNKKVENIPKNKTSQTGKSSAEPHPVIRTKAVRCSKVIIPRVQTEFLENPSPQMAVPTSEPSNSGLQQGDTTNFFTDFDIADLLTSDALNSFLDQEEEMGEDNKGVIGHFPPCSDFLVPEIEHPEGLSGLLQLNEALELKTLASFLNSEDEWIAENNQAP